MKRLLSTLGLSLVTLVPSLALAAPAVADKADNAFMMICTALVLFMSIPGIALFYGACFWGMALVLGWVFRTRPEYAMSLASGCLLMGPFLAMGLYDTSRRREAGLPPELGASITCWDRHVSSMSML